MLECRGKLGLVSRRTVGYVNVSVSLERQRTTVVQVRNGERDKDRFKESSEIIEYVTSDVTQADMEVSLDFTMMDKVSLTFDPFNMTSYRVKNRENFETKYLQWFEAFG